MNFLWARAVSPWGMRNASAEIGTILLRIYQFERKETACVVEDIHGRRLSALPAC